MSKDQTDWKSKFNELLGTCQSELKKTTQIGKKMLSASQSNADLHDTYEALGIIFKKYIEDDKIKIEDEEVEVLIQKAKRLESDLEGFESDVRNLKKS